MADQPRTRQELYERIRQTSKDEVILEEMIRLGFWPKAGVLPEDPADEIRRRAELQQQLEKQREQHRHLYNEQALIKEMRKRRLLESRRKRQETKERHERERQARAEAWRQKQEKEIVYLGAGVSAGLGRSEGNPERLRAASLPRLKTAPEVAAALGISIGALRFLAFSRKTSTVSHYIRFRIPKKTGGERLISAPMKRLKQAQTWILKEILEKIAPHEAVHGFRSGCSIVSNARPHLQRDVIINVDLKDFFPTVGYRRVKGMFRALGYSEEAATLFALLCTEPEVEAVDLDGKRFYVAQGERHLPQGAPTSPAITNLLCRRLDRRLTKMAGALGFTYTRYADDLTFSASGDSVSQTGEVLLRLRSIVAHEGFYIHPDKTRVLRRGRRQEVTGIVVNAKPNIPRDTLRRFRATLFQIEKDGPKDKRWGVGRDVIASIRGFANYVQMVNPEKGTELLAQVERIIAKYGWKAGPSPHAKKRPPKGGEKKTEPATQTAAATAAEAPAKTGGSEADASDAKKGEPPKKKWWRLF
jgi:retron-type reverse transcriptase